MTWVSAMKVVVVTRTTRRFSAARNVAIPAATVPSPSSSARASRSPASVSATVRPARRTSVTPNSASSARTACVTAAWVTFSARPASAKLPLRAVASKARRADREGKSRQRKT